MTNYQSPQNYGWYDRKNAGSSIVDDPVETRQLFLEMEASLPIAVRFTEHGIKGLQQQLPDLELTKDKVFAIEKLLYSVTLHKWKMNQEKIGIDLYLR